MRKRFLSLLLVISMILPMCSVNVSAASLPNLKINFENVGYNNLHAEDDVDICAYEDITFTWDSVSGATYYQYAIKLLDNKTPNPSSSNEPGTVISSSSKKTGTRVDVELRGPGLYKFTMGAYNSNGPIHSDWSYAYVLVKEEDVVVNTLTATNVTTESFTMRGELDTKRNYYTGFKWGTSKSNLNNTFKEKNLTPAGDIYDHTYVCNTPGTTYYYKAIAYNLSGEIIAEGSIKSVTTDELPDDIDKPIVTTVSSSDETDSSVKLSGKLTSTGGSSSVEYGFYFGHVIGNSYNVEKVKVGTTSSAKSFSCTIDKDDYTILSSGQEHDYYAYAKNEAGEVRGEIKQFTLERSDELDVETDRFGLYIGYADGDSQNHVTKNLTLPTTGAYAGSTITWKSSNTSVISNSGVVTRPSETSSDTKVTLTATVKKGTASATESFTVTVLKKVTAPTISSATVTPTTGYVNDTKYNFTVKTNTATEDLLLIAYDGYEISSSNLKDLKCSTSGTTKTWTFWLQMNDVNSTYVNVYALNSVGDKSAASKVNFTVQSTDNILSIYSAKPESTTIQVNEKINFEVVTSADADNVAIKLENGEYLYANSYSPTTSISSNKKTWKFSVTMGTPSPKRTFTLYASKGGVLSSNYKVINAVVVGNAGIQGYISYTPTTPKTGETITFTVYANQYTDKVSLSVGGTERATSTTYTDTGFLREFKVTYAFQTPGTKAVDFYAWQNGNKIVNSLTTQNVYVAENSNKIENVTINTPYNGYSLVKGNSLNLSWSNNGSVAPDTYSIYLGDTYIGNSNTTTFTIDSSYFSTIGDYSIGIYAAKEGYTPSTGSFVSIKVISTTITTTFDTTPVTMAKGDTFTFSGTVSSTKLLNNVVVTALNTSDNSVETIASKTAINNRTFDLSKLGSFVIGDKYLKTAGNYVIRIAAQEIGGTSVEIASKPITVTAGLASIKAEKQESETSSKMFKFTMTFSEIPQSAYLQFDSKSTNYDYLSDSACISNPAFKINVSDYTEQNGKYVYTKTLAINDSGNPNDGYNRKVRIIYKDNSGNSYYSSEAKFVVNPSAEKLDKPVVLSPTYNQKFEVENDVDLVWDYSGDVEPDEYIVNVYRDSTSAIIYSKTVSDTELTIPDSEISEIGTYTAYIYAKKSNYENSDSASTVFIVKEKKVDSFISDVTPKEGKTNDTYTFSFTSSKKLSAAYILFDNPKESSTAWLTEENSNIPEFRFDITDYEINDDGDYVYTKKITIGQHGHVDNNYVRKFRVVYGYFNWLIPVVKKSDINTFTVAKNDVKGITDAVIEEVGATTVTVSAMPTCEYDSNLRGTFTVWVTKNGKSTAKCYAEGVWDGNKYVAKIDGLSPLSEYYIQAILKENGKKTTYPQPSSSTYVKTTDYTPPIVEMKDISVRGTRVLLTASVKDTSGSDMSYYGFALRWGEDGYEDLRASNYNKNTGEFSYDISVLKNGGGLGPNTEFTVIPYAKNKKAQAQGEGKETIFKTGSAGIHFVNSKGYVIKTKQSYPVGSKIPLKTNIYGSDYTSLKYVVYNRSYGEVYPAIDVDLNNTSATIDTSVIQPQDLIIEAHLQLADGSVAKTVLEVTLTVPVTDISVPEKVVATIGEKITIIPQFSPANATNKSYTVIPENGKDIIEVKGKDIIAKKSGQQYVSFTSVENSRISYPVLIEVQNSVIGAPTKDELFPQGNGTFIGPNLNVNKDGVSQTEPVFQLPIGFEFEFAFQKFSVGDNKLKIFFANLPISDLINGKDVFGFDEYEAYKKAVSNKKVDKLLEEHNQKWKDGKSALEWGICGWAEFDYVDGILGELREVGGEIVLEKKLGEKIQYIPTTIPVYYKLSGSIGGSGKLTWALSPTSHITLELTPEGTFGLAGGAGISGVMYVEIGGEVKASFPIQIDHRGLELKVQGTAQGSVEAGFLIFKENVKFPVPEATFGPFTIIPFQNTLSLMSLYEENTEEKPIQIDEDIAEISRAYLDMPSSFNTGVANQISLFGLNDEGRKTDQLVKNNLYPDNEVTSIELSDGRKLMVWVDDVGLERTSLNRTGLFYSVCENGIWSMPQRVDTNDYTADFSPELSNNNGEVYLSWQSADCIFEDGTALDEYYTHIGVSSMKFDGEKFVERQNFYSQDSKYRNMQNTISDGSKTATLWVTNSENDYTGLTGTNSIHYSEYLDGVWSEEKVLIDNIPYLMEYSASYDNGEIVVAYAADTDKNLAGEEDINIYLCDETGNTSVVSNGTSYNPIISNGMLYWAQEDTVHSCDINNITAINDVVVNNGKVYDFELFDNTSNKMIYWADGSKIYASMYKNGAWSTPSVCTTVSGTINSISASGDDGTEFIVSVKREDSDTVDLIVCNVVENVDLALSEYVSYEKDDVIPNGNLEVEFSIKNQGNISVETAEVSFVDDEGNVLQTVEKDLNLKPYDSKDLTVTYKLPSEIKQQPITVLVNPIGYDDSDDSDNSASINIGNPELIIKKAETIYENGVPYVKISVENSGYTGVENIPVNIKYNDETIITETFTVNTNSSTEKLIVVDKSRFADVTENVWLTAQLQTDEWNLGYNDTETFLFINNKGENEFYIQSAELHNNILSLDINNKQTKEFAGTLNVVETYTDGTQHVETIDIDLGAKSFEEVQVTLKPEKPLSSVEVSVYDGTSIRSNEVIYVLFRHFIIDAKHKNGIIDVTVEKDDTNGYIIVALYNDKGAMLSLSKQALTEKDVYSFDVSNSAATKARIFIWSDLSTLKPLSDVFELNI